MLLCYVHKNIKICYVGVHFVSQFINLLCYAIHQLLVNGDSYYTLLSIINALTIIVIDSKQRRWCIHIKLLLHFIKIYYSHQIATSIFFIKVCTSFLLITDHKDNAIFI